MQIKSLPANSPALNPARCPGPFLRDTHSVYHLVLRLVVTHVRVRLALLCVPFCQFSVQRGDARVLSHKF